MASPESSPDPVEVAQDIIAGRDRDRNRQVEFQIPYRAVSHLANFLRSLQMVITHPRRDALEEDVISPESEQLWWITANKLPEFPSTDEQITEIQRNFQANLPFSLELSFAEIETIGVKIIQNVYEGDEYRFFDPHKSFRFSEYDELQKYPEYSKRMERELIGAFQQTQRAFVLAGGRDNPELRRRIVALKRHRHLERI